MATKIINLKFRHFLTVDSFVHIRIVGTQFIDRKTGEPGRVRIKFKNFKQLQEVLGEFSKRIKLQLDIHQLTDENINKLEELIMLNQGEKQLNLLLFERQNKIKLDMSSRSKMVDINKEFLTELKEMNFHYKIIR